MEDSSVVCCPATEPLGGSQHEVAYLFDRAGQDRAAGKPDPSSIECRRDS